MVIEIITRIFSTKAFVIGGRQSYLANIFWYSDYGIKNIYFPNDPSIESYAKLIAADGSIRYTTYRNKQNMKPDFHIV